MAPQSQLTTATKDLPDLAGTYYPCSRRIWQFTMFKEIWGFSYYRENALRLHSLHGNTISMFMYIIFNKVVLINLPPTYMTVVLER